MRVLIIPEDFRNDQYLLRPLFDRLFRSLSIPANVAVCQDPLLGGIREALKSERLQEIVERYDAMIDLFILCVDRDGELARRNRLDQIEAEFDGQRRFLAENAWEELETWTLAGLDLPWRWSEVRAEVSVKERYFAPLARQRGVAGGLGQGRMRLGEEAARNITKIRQKCREDFDQLAHRAHTLLTSPALESL